MTILGPPGGTPTACFSTSSLARELSRHTPSAAASRASELLQAIEEQEGGTKAEITPKTISSSSLDEAIMPTPPSLADDFRLFQELVKRVADMLYILLEEVQDAHQSSNLRPPQRLPSQLMRPF